jgi:hypothetical protein
LNARPLLSFGGVSDMEETMKAEATSWIVILLCFLAWAVDIAIIYGGRAQ